MDPQKVALQKFFTTKKKYDRKKRLAINSNTKTIKLYSFVSTPEKFALVSEKGEEVVAVMRKQKVSANDQLIQFQKQSIQLQQQVLNLKYRLLFEYDPIDALGQIIDKDITPIENRFHVVQKKQKRILKLQQKVEDKTTLEQLKMSKKTLQEQLKDEQTMEGKKDILSDYIMTHKKILDFIGNTSQDILEINPDEDEDEDVVLYVDSQEDEEENNVKENN